MSLDLCTQVLTQKNIMLKLFKTTKKSIKPDSKKETESDNKTENKN